MLEQILASLTLAEPEIIQKISEIIETIRNDYLEGIQSSIAKLMKNLRENLDSLIKVLT